MPKTCLLNKVIFIFDSFDPSAVGLRGRSYTSLIFCSDIIYICKTDNNLTNKKNAFFFNFSKVILTKLTSYYFGPSDKFEYFLDIFGQDCINVTCVCRQIMLYGRHFNLSRFLTDKIIFSDFYVHL